MNPFIVQYPIVFEKKIQISWRSEMYAEKKSTVLPTLPTYKSCSTSETHEAPDKQFLC